MALITVPIRLVYFLLIGWWLGTIWLLIVLVLTLLLGLLGAGMTERLWASVPTAYTLAGSAEPPPDDRPARGRDRRPRRDEDRRQPGGFSPLFIIILIIIVILIVAL